MSRLAGWFRSGAKADDASVSDGDSGRDNVAKEMEDIDDAMNSAALIMNDDIDGAWEWLQTGDSSFHQLGLAVTIFMRSVLGFEKDVMSETTAKLDECEARAAADFKKAQRRGKARAGSTLYPPGTEFELVRAETQLMGAVVGVLHESLIEAMKSFYKLRRAFLTLDAIIAAEEKALAERADRTDDDGASSNTTSVDAKDTSSGLQTPANPTEPSTTATTPEGSTAGDKTPDDRPRSPLHINSKLVTADTVLLDNPLEIFVHTGANMCFGILLLILTLVPPAFSRILSVVGFSGDRERGVRMLWRATAYANVNGALSAMILLAYYNGLLGVVDILPDKKDFDEHADVVGPPRDKCDELLASMRLRYPSSRLWRVEEARQHANEQDLPRAIEILTTGEPSRMKQVAAVNNFELSISYMFAQDWDGMRDCFLRCLEVNDWSPALYYYMAGCASLELYRDARRAGDEVEARRQKTKTEDFFRKAPSVVGRKKFMARQLPIESYLHRKIQKWEERARAAGVDLADAVGPSPALEMSYMWNGPKRMGPVELERGMANLAWERCTAKGELVEAIKKEVDEMGIWALLNATLLKRMGKFDEARALLDEHILKQDKSAFKGPTRDDYVQAAGNYEVASIAWVECCNPPGGTMDEVAAYRRAKFDECQKQLDIVKVWEAYYLDARIGMRVQSGLETLAWFKKKMAYN
ncbi:Mitochondrial outer membrane protein iml-2 [Neonectria ditissima]|uniref:Inclusion body clearance protein IML2 n=1 Tax=Neonectria ditissima TaxID=78410 RepID=A0A0P7AW54_9HYPO|nr:Mitochondrial outer membrane protein iml-2 [Neonectria ditissima]